MTNLIVKFRSPAWSPYAAGVLLGLTSILSVAIGHHLLGASGAVASVATSLVTTTIPFTASNVYFQLVNAAKLNWEVVLLVGVFFGGMLGALSSGTWRLRWNDDPLWLKAHGPSRLKRFVLGFVAAVIIQFGASIAGGCTSGLAISGGQLLAPSAFLFMAGMFASGIIVALVVFGKRY
jgi:uncharacterized protein